MTTTAPQKPAENAIMPVDKVASEFLQKFGKSLEEYAIREYNHGAFLKSAMIAMVDNSDLSAALKTDQGKMSLFSALRYAATVGLSLNPQEGKSCLIPYGNKIQYQIMKNGMIDLAMESGKVEFIACDYVRENDKFSLTKSVHGDEYNFIPAIKNRGDVLGYFAALKLRSGGTHVKWMTTEEIIEHRKKYSEKSRMPETGYGLKTIMKALLRSVSISTDLDTAIGADDFYEAEFKVEKGTGAEAAAEKLKAEKAEPAAATAPKGGDLL